MINQDLQRAIGQTAQIEPWEIISGYDFGCIFYANRKCNLDGDFCAEGPGCPYECHPSYSDRIRELMRAEKDGRIVLLPCKQGDTFKRGDTLWTFCTYPFAKVYKFNVTDISMLNGRTMLNTDLMGVVDATNVGKTVFLTREEAEKALEENRCGE